MPNAVVPVRGETAIAGLTGLLASLSARSGHELGWQAEDVARYALWRAPSRGAVERLLLAYEELAPTALRHGRSPVEVTVTSNTTSWLLEVSDAAAEQPPSPAIGRDPARGGLGLHLAVRLCDAHCWMTDGHCQTVWARIDYTRAEIRSTARQGRARLRGHRGRDH